MVNIFNSDDDKSACVNLSGPQLIDLIKKNQDEKKE